jgi:nucleoid-associated protein YgaU
MMKTHTVRPGDTLESIAKAYYNDDSLDDYLFQANTTVIQNSNVLYPGQVIVIPHLPLLKWLD